MNSTVRPIFNEKIAEICGSRKQSMGPIDVLKSQILRLLFINNFFENIIYINISSHFKVKKKCKLTVIGLI